MSSPLTFHLVADSARAGLAIFLTGCSRPSDADLVTGRLHCRGGAANRTRPGGKCVTFPNQASPSPPPLPSPSPLLSLRLSGLRPSGRRPVMWTHRRWRGVVMTRSASGFPVCGAAVCARRRCARPPSPSDRFPLFTGPVCGRPDDARRRGSLGGRGACVGRGRAAWALMGLFVCLQVWRTAPAQRPTWRRRRACCPRRWLPSSTVSQTFVAAFASYFVCAARLIWDE